MKRIISIIQLNFTKVIITLLTGTVFLAGYLSVQAFQSPTSNPPAGNTSAPINIGEITQTKAGDLVATRFGADEYCDSDFTNCATGIGGGGSITMGIPYMLSIFVNGDNTMLCPNGSLMVGMRFYRAKVSSTGGSALKDAWIICAKLNGVGTTEVGETTWRTDDWVVNGQRQSSDGSFVYFCPAYTRNVWCEDQTTGDAVLDLYCTGTRPSTYKYDLPSSGRCWSKELP